jgi:hypothetical protein
MYKIYNMRMMEVHKNQYALLKPYHLGMAVKPHTVCELAFKFMLGAI